MLPDGPDVVAEPNNVDPATPNTDGKNNRAAAINNKAIGVPIGTC